MSLADKPRHGHQAVGLTGTRIEPKVSLGAWILAAMLADLLVFALLIAGIERVHAQPGVTVNRIVADMPYSHSLLMDAIWAGAFAGSYFLWRRYGRGAWLLLVAALSHRVLDFVSHRPDMPLAPGIHAVFGLGLWNSIPATLLVEGGLWLLAIIIYVRAIGPNLRGAPAPTPSGSALCFSPSSGTETSPPGWIGTLCALESPV